MVGFLLCLEHPQRFEHFLALNIITPWPSAPSPRGLLDVARLWYQVAIAAPWLGSALLRRTSFVRRLITTGAVHDAWSPAELDTFTELLRAPERADASVQLYRTFLTRELWPFLRGDFNDRRLSVPTLLLHGTRDLAIDYRSLGDWRSHADAMSLELREDSGHFIAEELPEVVAERALALFANDASGSAAPAAGSSRARPPPGAPAHVSSSSGKARWRRGGTRKFWRRVAVMKRSRPRFSAGTLYCWARSGEAWLRRIVAKKSALGDEDAEVQLRLLGAVGDVKRVVSGAIGADVDRVGVRGTARALQRARVARVGLAVECADAGASRRRRGPTKKFGMKAGPPPSVNWSALPGRVADRSVNIEATRRTNVSLGRS